jgi:hypothetical protein
MIWLSGLPHFFFSIYPLVDHSYKYQIFFLFVNLSLDLFSSAVPFPTNTRAVRILILKSEPVVMWLSGLHPALFYFFRLSFPRGSISYKDQSVSFLLICHFFFFFSFADSFPTKTRTVHNLDKIGTCCDVAIWPTSRTFLFFSFIFPSSISYKDRSVSFLLICHFFFFPSQIHFRQRHEQYTTWIKSEPVVMWLSGLHVPEAYLTALVQTACRKNKWPLDKTSLFTKVRCISINNNHPLLHLCYVLHLNYYFTFIIVKLYFMQFLYYF